MITISTLLCLTLKTPIQISISLVSIATKQSTVGKLCEVYLAGECSSRINSKMDEIFVELLDNGDQSGMSSFLSLFVGICRYPIKQLTIWVGIQQQLVHFFSLHLDV